MNKILNKFNYILLITAILAIVGSVIKQNFWYIYTISPLVKVLHGFTWVTTVILAIIIPFKNETNSSKLDVIKEKINGKTNKEKYMLVLILLFLVSFTIAILGSIAKQDLGYEYVFHSWMSIVHGFSWTLTIGLAIMISLTYLNIQLGFIVIPFILIAMSLVVGINYTKEVRSGQYIILEVQQLGEKVIRYYEDVNIFIMKRSHEEIVR